MRFFINMLLLPKDLSDEVKIALEDSIREQLKANEGLMEKIELEASMDLQDQLYATGMVTPRDRQDYINGHLEDHVQKVLKKFRIKLEEEIMVDL